MRSRSFATIFTIAIVWSSHVALIDRTEMEMLFEPVGSDGDEDFKSSEKRNLEHLIVFRQWKTVIGFQ